MEDPKITPNSSELEILQALWPLGEARVQSINDELCKTKTIGYTTTLKTMQIMEQKGLLGRRKEGKSHIYFPLIAQSVTQNSLLERLLSSAFGGSKSSLVMQLLGGSAVSKQELEEIQTFLKEIEPEDKQP